MIAQPEDVRRAVTAIAQQTAELLGVRGDITDADIVINPDYAYPVYGVPSKETVQAIRLAARLEGFITDPVYEGKCMQALIDLVGREFFEAGSKVLFVHLGGTPALNAYSYIFKND